MRNLTVVVLMVFCFFSSASAQTLVPEHEILTLQESLLGDDKHPDTIRMMCGDHFLYAGGGSAIPLLTFGMRRLPTDKSEAKLLVVMQKRNVEVRIDNGKSAPTAEVLSGPKLILRINRNHYEKAARCLPNPQGA